MLQHWHCHWKKNATLKVDTSSYEGYKLRKYELQNCFNINTPQAFSSEISQYSFQHPVKKIWNKLRPQKKLRILGLPYEEALTPRTLLNWYDRISAPHKRSTYQEPHYHYDHNFFAANDNVYLQGYWMSWKYFIKYEQQVRAAYAVKRELVQHLDLIAAAMKATNSISIHIRRTDYTDPAVVQLKDIIPVQYYKNAVKYMQEEYNNVVLYFFSDDMEWVKQNLQFGNMAVYYIDTSVTSSAIEDFYLMTQCRHNIIANSTFSWWAAYLNTHKNKIVIAPQKWYSDAAHYDYKDVYPPEWIVLP